jgi:ketosteroid isomerase-like protein
MRELHENFSNGNFQEMNEMYSEDFQGWFYMPREDKVQFFNSEQIKQGNQGASEYYKDKKIKFIYSGLKIIPQSEKQAAVSYEITHLNNKSIVRALSLEVWRKEADGKWRIIRWYEEKGPSL